MHRSAYHLAQVNIAHMRAPLESALMAGFVARLDDINALADGSPGFVWRLQTPEGDATALRPWGDDHILVNMSVWEDLETLREYVYRSAHVEVMRRRREWFERFDGVYMAMWWVPRGHLPTVAEAKERVEHLRRHGPTEHAFTFKAPFPAPDAPQEPAEAPEIEWDACPA